MLNPPVKIGLIGGVSWVSTREYYRRINTFFESRLGPYHTPDIVLCSLPFGSILEYQESGDLESEAAVLAEATSVLESAGVQFCLICSNTTSRTIDLLRRDTTVEFLDIVDAVNRAVQRSGASRIGLLGTRYVMEGGTYVKRLEAQGVEVRLPNKPDRDEVHRVIYEELCVNDIRDESRARLGDVIRRFGGDGCDSAVLGCTELPILLPEPSMDGVDLIDSLESHLEALYEAIGFPRAEDRSDTERATSRR